MAMKILGIGGSLRKGSYSAALLRAATELLPNGVTMEIADLSGIPMFNQDDEASPPEPVRRFKSQIKEADAILFSTPEYNFGIPGYLKNAIDWASRPNGDNSFKDKPAAIMSSSGGMLGGIKAQLQLRQILVYLDMHALNDSIVASGVNKIIDADGKLTDQRMRDRVKQVVEELVAWANRLSAKR